MSFPNEADSVLPRHLLFPIDGSEHCKRAFEWYLDKFYLSRDKVTFLHVAECQHSLKDTANLLEEYIVDSMHKDLHKSVQFAMQSWKVLKTEAKKYRLPVSFEVRYGGNLGDAIIEFAREMSANIIVIGHRGLGTFRRTVLGSVSNHLVHNARMPVLLVPPM